MQYVQQENGECYMCIIEGCNNKVLANGLCSKHYSQMRRHGKIFEYSYKDKRNHIEIKEDYAEIYLIDLEDIDLIKNIKWHKSELQRSTYYCISNGKQGKRIHRLILNITDPSVIVDHINHNGLDNRKSNLRICNNSQNICNCHIPKNNKSGYKGVYWSENRQKWCAQISINNKTKNLGRFTNYEDAIKTRNKAAIEYYGEFANEN